MRIISGHFRSGHHGAHVLKANRHQVWIKLPLVLTFGGSEALLLKVESLLSMALPVELALASNEFAFASADENRCATNYPEGCAPRFAQLTFQRSAAFMCSRHCPVDLDLLQYNAIFQSCRLRMTFQYHHSPRDPVDHRV